MTKEYIYKTFGSVAVTLTLSLSSVGAYPQQIVVGKATPISIKIDQSNNSARCNLQIEIPRQGTVEKEVSAPSYETSIDITAQQPGPLVIQWKGKTKFRGLNSIAACNGSGSIQVMAGLSAEQAKEKWDRYFAQLDNSQADCIKGAIQISGVKIQSLDPNEVVVGPDDSVVKPLLTKCDSFTAAKTIWTGKDPSALPCLANGISTVCEGVYAERQTDGKLVAISKLDAIRLHLEGKPWTTAQRESNETKEKRLKQEEESKARQAAEEEKKKQWIASPEYKKQQAEIERKRVAEEKEAAAKAQKESLATKNQNDSNLIVSNDNRQNKKYKFANKLNADQVRQKFLKVTWTEDLYFSFIYNYSFVTYLQNIVHNGSGEDPYKAFGPYINQIEAAKNGLDGVLQNIAKALDMPVSLVQKAFELESNPSGGLYYQRVNAIWRGKEAAKWYWLRYPSGMSFNFLSEFWNSKSPKDVFVDFYPKLISEYNSDIERLQALVQKYEDEQYEIFLQQQKVKDDLQAKQTKEKEDREKWLQSAEGKKYLKDEQDKQRRMEREIQVYAAEQKRQEQEEQMRIAKEYPYYALVSCSLNGQHLNIYSCFNDDVETEFELKNGGDYGLYKVFQLLSVGKETREGLLVNLRASFQLKIQNASANLVQGVKIVNRSTNKVVFEKQVARFGVISVRN